MTDLKIAGAPISWGVCEVPGRGHQLTPDRVLREMRDVGLAATELGPEGFLPAEPDAMGGRARAAPAAGRRRVHPAAAARDRPRPRARGRADPRGLPRRPRLDARAVRFKDVDAAKAQQVQDGRYTYTEGVNRGMYRPLGTGAVDVTAIVKHLTDQGYDGWYTLEQDTILTEEPTGEGPVGDVRTSADNLRAILAATG